jgi:hypothetical protein
VATRLARARERLRARLTCRGVALSAVALAALLTPEAVAAAVPPSLAAATATAAGALLGGKVALAAAISAQALALMQGMLRELLLVKLKILATAAVVLIAVAGAGFGVGRVFSAGGFPQPGPALASPAFRGVKDSRDSREADPPPAQESREASNGPAGPFLAPTGSAFQSIRTTVQEEAADTHFHVRSSAVCFVFTLDGPTVRILFPTQPVRKRVTVYTPDGQAIHVTPRNGSIRGWDIIAAPDQEPQAPTRRIYVVPVVVSPDEYLAPRPGNSGRSLLYPEEARQ